MVQTDIELKEEQEVKDLQEKFIFVSNMVELIRRQAKLVHEEENNPYYFYKNRFYIKLRNREIKREMESILENLDQLIDPLPPASIEKNIEEFIKRIEVQVTL